MEDSLPTRDRILVVVVVLVGLGAMNLIFFADAFSETDTVNPTSAGLLGDFVGGYVGTLFTLINVVLLFATLSLQRLALRAQHREIIRQERVSEMDKFETKFYELLRMHRDNVDELSFKNRHGRAVFVNIFNEFQNAHTVVRLYFPQMESSTRLIVAYYTVFFGVGQKSTRMLAKALDGRVDEASVNGFANEMRDYLRGASTTKRSYVPDGHQHRLGHYFRHLYQAVDYIDGRKELNGDQKRSYVKTLRAQLSTHEQAILFLNSLSPLGRAWIQEKKVNDTTYERGLLEFYGLVKHIPLGFFHDYEVMIEGYFPPNYFEYQEVALVESKGE